MKIQPSGLRLIASIHVGRNVRTMRGLLATALNKLTHEVRTLTHVIVRFKSRSKAATKQDLEELEDKIMATQKEQAAQLRAVAEQVRKLGTETTGLKDKVAVLEEALANQPDATQDLKDAVAEVAAAVQAVDDLVPDAAPAFDIPADPENTQDPTVAINGRIK